MPAWRACRRVLRIALTLGAAGACARAPRPTPTPVAGVSGDSSLVRVLASERAGDATTRVPRTLAVMPFALTSGDPAIAPLAYGLADLLTTDLGRSPRITLVERARLDAVLRELALTATGRVDSLTGPRVGRLIRARRLVVGTVGSATAERLAPGAGTGNLRLGVRLADVGSGTIANAVDASAPLRDVLAAEKALAFRIFDALGVVLTPAEREAVDRRPTSDLAALLAYGRGVQAQYEGDYRRAADEFRRAERLDPRFREAQQRGDEAHRLSEVGTLTPVVVPGLRALDGAIGSMVDRLNRPLDPISSLTRPSTPADPSFPFTTATVVIVVSRP